jgi:hypothetical protein
VAHIADAQLHQVTGSQLAVDRQIEQGRFAGPVCDLEADANRFMPQNSRLSPFACADRSAALAIAALGIATKFNKRAEHFRPATLEVRIPL